MAEMSPLRRRMIEDMTIRNLSPATQRSYLHAVLQSRSSASISAERLGLEDVQAYRVHRAAGVVVGPDQPPAFMSLALDVGFRCLPLIVERVELLLQAMLGRDAGVHGAAQRRFASLRSHGDAACRLGRRANAAPPSLIGVEGAQRPRNPLTCDGPSRIGPTRPFASRRSDGRSSLCLSSPWRLATGCRRSRRSRRSPYRGSSRVPCLLVAPPNRRSRLRPCLLHELCFEKLGYFPLGLAEPRTCRRNQAMIIALRRSARQHKLRVVEFDGHVRPFAFRAPANPGPSLTRAPDRSDCRGEGLFRSASAHADVHTHAPFPTESQSFLGAQTQTFLSCVDMPSPARHELARQLLPWRVRASLRPQLRSSLDRVTHDWRAAFRSRMRRVHPL